ncbi:MAG: hypothetical protein WBA13_21140 [Microcoleaceae cyanobacterium]
MNLSEGWAIFIVGQVIVLLAITWKVAAVYGQLKRNDELNKHDLNNIGKKVRRIQSLSWQRLDNIEAFLEKKAAYHPPTLEYFEDDNNG